MPKSLLLFTSISLLILSSCSSVQEKMEESDIGKEILQLNYAKGFDVIVLKNGDKVVKLYDLEKGGGLLEELLLSKSAPNDSIENTIQIPIQTSVCLSTTHIAYMDRLNAIDKVNAVSYAQYVKNKNALQNLESGHLKNLSNGDDVDFELLLDIYPDVFFVYPFGNENYSRYKEAGITCFPVSEYLEKHPLGRAEWIKLFGVLLDKEEEANQIFEQIEKDYHQTMTLTENIAEEDKPSVFTGSEDAANWYAPPGNSFIAQFLQDAGSDYIFKDLVQGENVTLEFEVFYEQAFDTDYWGKVVYNEGDLTYNDVAQDDTRYEKLKAFKDQHIFFCNATDTDYFGDAIMEPEVILKDLVKVFYPEKLPEYSPVYFKLAAP